MSNVVALPRRDEDTIVWRCNCGSITHFVRADATIQCAACDHIAVGEDGSWRKHLPPVPAHPAETEDGDQIVTNLNDATNTLRRMVRRIDPETVSTIIVVYPDGRISTVSRCETAEQFAWLRRRLDDAVALLQGEE